MASGRFISPSRSSSRPPIVGQSIRGISTPSTPRGPTYGDEALKHITLAEKYQSDTLDVLYRSMDETFVITRNIWNLALEMIPKFVAKGYFSVYFSPWPVVSLSGIEVANGIPKMLRYQAIYFYHLNKSIPWGKHTGTEVLEDAIHTQLEPIPIGVTKEEHGFIPYLDVDYPYLRNLAEVDGFKIEPFSIKNIFQVSGYIVSWENLRCK